METTKTSATSWLYEHGLKYYTTLCEYQQHRAYAEDEPAVRERLDWLAVQLSNNAWLNGETDAAKLCSEAYDVFGQACVSIRAALGASYREDAVYRKLNAARPAMVRARVVQTMI